MTREMRSTSWSMPPSFSMRSAGRRRRRQGGSLSGPKLSDRLAAVPCRPVSFWRAQAARPPACLWETPALFMSSSPRPDICHPLAVGTWWRISSNYLLLGASQTSSSICSISHVIYIRRAFIRGFSPNLLQSPVENREDFNVPVVVYRCHRRSDGRGYHVNVVQVGGWACKPG